MNEFWPFEMSEDGRLIRYKAAWPEAQRDAASKLILANKAGPGSGTKPAESPPAAPASQDHCRTCGGSLTKRDARQPWEPRGEDDPCLCRSRSEQKAGAGRQPWEPRR